MSERYTRLFALEENLYSDGSPVVISAGALLKDNQTGAVLAQLKIRNIGDRRIKAAAVRIACFDTLGKPLEGVAEKEYLDLDAGRGAEFGQKTLISLPDASARSFSVSVAWVAFSDNTVWNASGEELSALPKPDSLSKALGDEELVKQYRLKYGAGTKSFPQKHKDLWFCACGALNRADEEVCHVCGQKLAALLPFDAEALKAEKDKRLQKEADERRRTEEQAKAAAAEKAKKSKKTAMIMTPIICLCIVAIIVFTQVVLPKQKYDKAMELSNAGDYEAALTLLDGLNYKDSEEKRETIYNKWLLINAKVGDTINFGTYEQDDDISNGKEIIEWIVLAKQNNRLFVISRYAIDARPYNAEQKEATWETCSLRQWLNTEFLDSAFSDSEKAMIAAVTVSAEKNPEYITSPGKSTQDKVLLLSIAEAERYFTSNDARACEPTAYAESNGASPAGNGNCWWRLRTPGDSQSCTGEVHCTGVILNTGSDVSFAGVAIRPAMWIDLSD